MSKVKMRPLSSILILVISLILVFSLFQVKAGVLADYGDAPDDTNNPGNVFAYPGVAGKFPSLYDTANNRVPGNKGTHHSTTDEEWLAESTSSTTTKEADALIVDNDSDDSGAFIFYDSTPGPPYIAWILVPISVASGAPDVSRYLNVVVDQNRDGVWGNTNPTYPEWAVINYQVKVTSGNIKMVESPTFQTENPTEASWMRVTLTRQPIDEATFASVGGWDGSAPATGFSYGETEDSLSEPQSFSNYEISLKSRTFTPPQDKITTIQNVVNPSPLDRVHVLMQLYHDPDEDQLSALDNAGVEILGLVPNLGWFASLPKNISPSNPALKPVRWVGEILPDDRRSEALQTRGVGDWAINLDGTVNLDLIFHSDISLADAKTIVASYGGTIIDESELINLLGVTIDSSKIADLAQEDKIEWIDEVAPPDTTDLEGARKQLGTDYLQNTEKLDGSGVKVMQREASEPGARAMPDKQHNDFLNTDGNAATTQVKYREDEARGDAAESNHATGVSGIIAGDGSQRADGGIKG